MDGGEDGVPDFDEVVAAGVAEDAEGGVGGVGGQDVADELIALDEGSRWAWIYGCWRCRGFFELGEVFCGRMRGGGVDDFSGQAGDVEDGFEIAVAFDKAWGRSLEVGFSELGFEEEIAELKVDLGAVSEGLIGGGW